MKTGQVSVTDHHKLIETDEPWTLCPCDNFVLATAWLFSHRDGHVLLFAFYFESSLFQQVNGPQITPLGLLNPSLTLLDRLTVTRAPL